jgi:glycosyltransferase involved in cell wall biosynthesis
MLVESVKAQTHSQWELLIMDDGSGDLDHPAVRPTLADPRIQTFRWYPNRGVSQATRFLMGQAKGEFWCYPGADDLLSPEFLVRRLAVMEEHPEVALVFGKGGQIDASGEEIWFHEGRLIFLQMEPFEGKLIEAEQMLQLLLTTNVVNTPSILVRTQQTLPILIRYNIDWRYSQDWFYWVLLAGNGLNFFYSGEILHSYRYHENSLSQSAESWAWRNVEPPLVLLTGLALAAQTGELASHYFRHLRTKLTANWLLRSARFRKHPSWPHWRSLAQSLSIRWFEWPSVVLQMMRILRIRRKYRANGLLLHGLPE